MGNVSTEKLVHQLRKQKSDLSNKVLEMEKVLIEDTSISYYGIEAMQKRIRKLRHQINQLSHQIIRIEND